MVDVKSLLKEARKHIDDKNYEEAQECCKNVLRKDKNNYLGLVLLGKSFQDSDKAPLAFQKAITTKPENILAWQGLANYYERKEDDSLKEKLFAIYDEILKLDIEEEKALDIITKLGQLGSTLKNSDSLIILINYINKKSDPKLTLASEKQIIYLLKSDILCNEENIPLMLNLLEKLLKRDPNECLELLYVKVIWQKSDFNVAVKEIINLEFFPGNAVLQEWLVKNLCKKYIEQESFHNLDIEHYVDIITKGIENFKYSNLLISMISYENGLYIDAYKKCVPLINYQQADYTEIIFILKCTTKLKQWDVTQKLLNYFLTTSSDPDLRMILKKFLFLSLAKQHKWKRAIDIINDIPRQSLSLHEQALLAECYIEANESVDNILENLQTTKYFCQLQALLLLKQNKYRETVSFLEKSDETPLNLFYLGKSYWELKEYELCLMNLLKAAKLNPEHADTFLYLGNFYYLYKHDLRKAKKCYEKAYVLNKYDSMIVKYLSEIYIKLEEKEADFEFLKTAEQNVQTSETWINFRLGLHYMRRKEWENAITKFRNVIRSDCNDIVAIECLADAYYYRGSFIAASKAYNKVISIKPNKSLHCLTKIGYIHSLLTQHEDAICTFGKVLSMDPYSILALKGITETWMRVAKKKLSAKLYGSARDCAQNGINFIIKAITKQRQFLCLWKMLGDLLIFVTKLPNKYAYVLMTDLSSYDNNDVVRKDKTEIISIAIACFSLIVKHKQQNASYDLASTYLLFYNETNKISNCHIAYKLTLQNIKAKPSVWRNWNLLGKICFLLNKYDIAQHCFIKALLLTRKWSIARIWCNLGTLYLKLKLFVIANYCFWRGQSTQIKYSRSWIGQALIAEVLREEEAMDLFRHASRLGYHPESALGYADWVCRIIKNHNYKDNLESTYIIEGLHAIPYAMDLMEWFLNYEQCNACAFTILGILQERSGLLQAAYKSYEKALNVVEEHRKNITLLNMGRILLRLYKYDEAIIIYKSITEASLHSAIGLALALFKKGLYEESYSAYDTALHWLSNDDSEKAEILVAMAGIVYMLKGADDAKTLLFHSIQISQKKPTAYSLLAICSLGLIQSDPHLSKLAVSELKRYEYQSEFGFDIGFLKSYIHVKEDNLDQAIKLLSDSLHIYPSNVLLWFYMAHYCLITNKPKAKAASSCAQRALCSAHYSESTCISSKMYATASISEHVAQNRIKALLLATKGLHLYPNQAEIWAALLYSLLTNKMWAERKQWMVTTASHMRRHLDMSRTLSRWVALLEKRLSKHLHT